MAMTWKPRLPSAAPSACRLTTTSASEAFSFRARSSMQSAVPVSSGLPTRTVAPRASSRGRISSAISQLNVCSGQPSLAVVPVTWQGFSPPRPSVTIGVGSGMTAACPGSR